FVVHNQNFVDESFRHDDLEFRGSISSGNKGTLTESPRPINQSLAAPARKNERPAGGPAGRLREVVR
ncbi:MAG: hypothetical protein KJ042_06205, partial [Deltaproteobacteria bacterium]|nr:hypothetical protein [Deltaproteobacteria bacterium]